ncbi:MAG: type III-A CRISPR-associated protein Csm2 [Fibromonadaceae bacterium]|nr:type III-A CRISPR-associated protein Csm2 [Fibromonadaceae bacterium]
MNLDNITPEFFVSNAQTYANSFVTEVKDRQGNIKYDGVTKNQLRRIFDEVKRFENISFDLPRIKMIISKTKYAVARAKQKNIKVKEQYEALDKFIEDGIKSIQNETHYKNFVSLFEAVYGFYYEKAPQGEG